MNFPPAWDIALKKFEETSHLARRIADFEAEHTTELGRKYDTLPKAARVLGVSTTCLRTRLDIAQSMDPFDMSDGSLYCLDDFIKNPDIMDAATVRIRVDERGFYTDDSGRVWCTVVGFYESLAPEIQAKTSKSALRNKIARTPIPKAKARAGNDKPNPIYLQKDLKEKILDPILNPIKTDKDGFFIDEEGVLGKPGEKYAERKTWQKVKDVKQFALTKGAKLTYGDWEKVPSVKAIGNCGHLDSVLYSETIIDEVLSYIFKAKNLIIRGECQVSIEVPTPETATTETRAAIKRLYVTVMRLGREVPVSEVTMYGRLRDKGCPETTGIDRRKGEEQIIFDLERAREIFAAQIRVRVETNGDGEVFEGGARYLTVNKFVEEQKDGHPELRASTLYKRMVRASRILKLTRRDKRTNRTITLFKESDLKRIARI